MECKYDVMFGGHMCYDEIAPHMGGTYVAPGSAVLCGAMAAACTGKRIAAVLRPAPADDAILDSMRDAGIRVFAVPADETTYSRVIHPSANVDEREMVLVRHAGFFAFGDMPAERAAHVHLAGISDHDVNLEFMRDLKASGGSLSTGCPEHEPRETLKFAAAMVSLKMDTPGPYRGSLADVLKRMEASHRDDH